MATSVPLLAPVVFPRLSETVTNGGSDIDSKRARHTCLAPWRRTRPRRLRPGAARSDVYADEDGNEDDEDRLAQSWGYAPDQSLSSNASNIPRKPAPPPSPRNQTARTTALLTWEDAAIDAFASSARAQDPNHDGTAAGGSMAADRDDDAWLQTAASSAPFSSNSIRTAGPSQTMQAALADPSRASNGLGPIRGRMLAVGLSDGSTVLYQARHDLRSTAAAEAALKLQSSYRYDDAATIGSSSPSPSSHQPASGGTGNGLLGISEQNLVAARSSSARSSSRISFSREPVVGSHVLSFGVSHTSAAGLSTMSASSTSSVSAAALQLEDPSAATVAVDTNVNALGESVKSPSRHAEHELSAQRAAAERSEHHHGMIGRTVEALGLSSGHHRDHSSHDSVSMSRATSAAGGEARRSSQQFSPLTAKSGARSPVKSRPSTSLASRQSSSRSVETLDDTGAGTRRSSSATSSPVNDPSFRVLLRLSDPDRSPVVALRLYQETIGGTSSSRRCLLVVHQEGRICSWSLQHGVMLWSIDLAQTKCLLESVPERKSEGESLSDEPSSVLYNSLTPMFSQLSMSMSSKRSTASAARGSLRGNGGAQANANEAAATGEARLRDGSAVQLASDVNLVISHGRSLAAVRDEYVGAMIVVDLQQGKPIAYEVLPGCSTSCSPAAQLVSGHRLKVSWVDACKGTLVERLVVLSGGSESPKQDSDDQRDIEEIAAEESIVHAALLEGDRTWLAPGHAIGLTRSKVTVWDRSDGNLSNARTLAVRGAQDVLEFDVVSGELVLRTKDSFVRCYIDKPSSLVTLRYEGRMDQAVLCRTPQLGSSSGTLLVASQRGQQRSQLQSPVRLTKLLLDSGHIEDVSSDARASLPGTEPRTGVAQSVGATALLPLSLERIVVAFRSGGIRFASLLELTQVDTLTSEQQNSIGYGKAIIVLRQALNPRAGSKLIVGGTAQGDVACWDVSTLELVATWSLSTSPIEALVTFGDEDNTLRLHGCLACVAADSSVSIIVLDGLRFLYTIPGRDARLQSLAVRADELLLTYDDGKARVWDLRSQELRRSIATDQAQALVLDGRGWWTVKEVEPYSSRNSGTSGVLSSTSCARGSNAVALLADFRRSVEVASRAVLRPQKQGSVYGSVKRDQPDPHTSAGDAEARPDERPKVEVPIHSPAARKVLGIARPLLTLALPIGIEPDWDAKIETLLGLAGGLPGEAARMSANNFQLGLGTSEWLAQPMFEEDAAQLWTVSSVLSTQRALICLSVLQILTSIQELSQVATELIDIVKDGVAEALGAEAFKDFSLPALTCYMLDANTEIQEAARLLFDAALGRMQQTQIEQLCDAWQPLLPVNQPPVMHPTASSALSLLGYIAVSHYKSLSPVLLKQLAQSISVFLADEAQPLHQSIAIDLCAAGFSIWQHYFDATSVVRSLFALATEKEASASASTADGAVLAENRTLARAATLRIASENTPLFMTTLSMDILHARSPAHCSATMKLVALMVRKKPEILYPNLPRLAEAVVKSLDPSHAHARDSILRSATVIISELVATYPSISFHERTQRLAVGTHEGAVIVYDLKTATRLFVLEGHRGAVSGAEFSRDGRRLVTVSSGEGVMCVWKVGSSFLGLFQPGTMPKQGGGGGAYRTLRFPQSEAAECGALPSTTFEWTSDKSLRVTIGEAQLNLSVD